MVPSGRILADDLQADHIILFSGQMERFVTTRSPDHPKIADQPVGQVDYVLVPDDVDGTQNFIVERYPDIFDKGAPFLQLQKEWTDVGVRQNAPERWRLYRVRPPSEAGKEGNPRLTLAPELHIASCSRGTLLAYPPPHANIAEAHWHIPKVEGS
jgi:hypothetical protein